jgi:hypothetical protein
MALIECNEIYYRQTLSNNIYSYDVQQHVLRRPSIPIPLNKCLKPYYILRLLSRISPSSSPAPCCSCFPDLHRGRGRFGPVRPFHSRSAMRRGIPLVGLDDADGGT